MKVMKGEKEYKDSQNPLDLVYFPSHKAPSPTSTKNKSHSTDSHLTMWIYR